MAKPDGITTPVYEYAGFLFAITTDTAGAAIQACPLPGQHPAAGKDKHRRAAIEGFNSENK